MDDAIDRGEVDLLVDETLIQLWEDILGIDGIDQETDFLDAGGDSLLALRMIAHIHQVFGVEISLADFFVASRLPDLSRLVVAALTEQIDSELLTAVESLSDEQVEALLHIPEESGRHGRSL